MRPLVPLLALVLVSGNAYAEVKWFPYQSKEYKIQVCLNTGMKVKTEKHGDWGVLAAKDGDVRIMIMALKGTATFQDMQKVAEKVTKIPGNYWKATRKSMSWNDFGQNATYLAEATDRVALAFLAKHGKYVDRNFIVFVNTSKENFAARKEAFNAWGKCLRALP